MYDLITFGNITSDLYFDANNLTTKEKRFYLAIGGKYFVENYFHFVGGGAANVAIGARKNRIKSAICGVVGNNEFRKAILHKLKLKKVSLKMILFKQQHLNLSVIFLKKDGSRTIINYETPKQDLIINTQLLNKSKNTRSVYLGNLPDVPISGRIKLLSYLKKHNVMIFLNLGTADMKKDKKDLTKLITQADVLILNRFEFCELVNKNPKKLNLKSNLLKLLPSLKQKLLVVTDAENGSYAYFENKIYYHRAIKPKKIIDTTGAGDAYTAGFISQYLKTEDIKKAMRTGAYFAAKILGKIGAN